MNRNDNFIQEKEKEFDAEVQELAGRFDRGEISGFEFDKKFRELSDKYLGTSVVPPTAKAEGIPTQ